MTHVTLKTTLSADQLLELIRTHAPQASAEAVTVEVVAVGEGLTDLDVHVNVPARIVTLDRDCGVDDGDDSQVVERAGRSWHENSWWTDGDAPAVARYAGGDV